MSSIPADEIDPVTAVRFTLSKSDKVATAGSCFAQHIAKTLLSEGYNYLITEQKPGCSAAKDENYGVFPARFANIYTTTQLLQLLQRAYGLFEPVDRAWRRHDGAFVDPFRPRIQDAGFVSLEDVDADLECHLAAVRMMFETCDVFIFTLGLTEAWRSKVDHAVFPLAPGVSGHSEESTEYEFVNYDAFTVASDLESAIYIMREINPRLNIILTVSPVPLIATYEDRHVLVSTIASKSALRVACDIVSQRMDNVSYFPSYEIITGPQRRSGFFGDDLREIRPEGVAHVMGLFKRHFLDHHYNVQTNHLTTVVSGPRFDEAAEMRRLQTIICDEEAIVAP